MLIDGHNKVIGPAFILQEWVLRTSQDAARVFHHAAQENAVTAMQRYFYREVRGNTSQLIRRLAMRLLNPEKAPKAGDAKAQERLDLWLHELDDQLLVKLNE